MKEQRSKLKNTERTSKLDNIEVYKAKSNEDVIRFYANEYEYVEAIDNHDGTMRIRQGNEKDDEKDKKDDKAKEKSEGLLSYVKKEPKVVVGIILICGIITLLMVGITMFLAFVINNLLISLLLIDFLFFIFSIVLIMFFEYTETSKSAKSKHSAEHMMVTFLEKNSRLPKDIDETKNISRFSSRCGSQEKTIELTMTFVECFITTILTIIVISNFKCENNILEFCILLAVYLLINILVRRLMVKYKIFNFLINPIQKGLNIIIQCCNTTKKVRDEDIIMAYCVAVYYIILVYPEFYSEEATKKLSSYCKD